MGAPLTLDKPKIGDIFRRVIDGDEDVYAIVGVHTRKGGTWVASMNVRGGHQSVDDSRARRGLEDWTPISWVFHKEVGECSPPGWGWDAEKERWIIPGEAKATTAVAKAADVPAAPAAHAVSAADARAAAVAAAAVEVHALPRIDQLPIPTVGEHHLAWRNRCRRKFPTLDGDAGKELLSEVWSNFISRSAAEAAAVKMAKAAAKAAAAAAAAADAEAAALAAAG